MRRISIAFTLTTMMGMVAAQLTGVAQDRQTSTAADDDTALRATLRAITLQKESMSARDLDSTLREGLRAANAKVREDSLLAIVSLAGGPRFTGREDVRQRWRENRGVVQELRPSVTAALNDSNAAVRKAAVLALGNMSFDLNRPDATILLGPGVTLEFTRRFARESDAKVRTELVKSLALCSDDSFELRDVLARAFDDQAPGVRQFAIAGAERLKAPEYTSRLFTVVQNDVPELRLAAARAIGSYGAVMRDRVGELKTLKDREGAGKLRDLLDQAIRHIESSR